MKVITKKLLEQVSNARKAIRKSTIETYEAVKLTAENGLLTIVGSSSIMTVVAKVKGEGDDSFICAVNANLLQTAIQKMIADEITLEKVEGLLKITGNKTKVTLPLLDITAFHERDISNDVYLEELDAEYLPAFTTACAHALAGKAMDPKMGSFYLEFGDGLKVTALDGKRISIRDNLKGDVKESLIIHGKPLCEALKMMNENIKISVPQCRTYVKIHCEDCEVTISTIDGVYYNIKDFVSLESNIVVKVNKEELINAVDVSSLIGRPILTINKDCVVVTCSKDYCGAAEIVLAASVNGLEEELRICLDNVFLMDALKSVEDEYVTLELVNGKTPARITSDNSVREIIMPVII